MKEGFDIHRRSSVRSFLVGLSMTCVRLWSFNIPRIEQDLQTTHSHMKENQNHMDVNDLWNYFKNSTSDSIKKNIPTKSIGNKTTLPCIHFWVVY
jgi:hypothetical protein